MATSTDLSAAIEEVRGQLPGEELEAGGLLAAGGGNWLAVVERRVGALPWWVISATVHAVIFLLATLLTVAMPPAQVDEVLISSDVAREKPPEYDEKRPRDVFRQLNEIEHDKQVEKPILLHEEAEITDHFETDNDMDTNTARGREDAISDIPLGGTGVCGSIGVGGGGMAGCFGYRGGGGRKRAVARFGGSKATESAVEAALRWLARHQEADGHWDSRRYEASRSGDVGNTGLALLAFLGAGYTEKSGRFADNVRRAQAWLMGRQNADGAVGAVSANSNFTYGHAIGGLALAESFGMARNPEVGKAAQKAVDYSLRVQQVPYLGWRYDPAVKDCDTSVTGWYVMQLKSAKVAGLRVDGAGFQGATNWVDKITTPDGWSGYTARGRDTCLTAVAMVCRQFMGVPNTDPILAAAAGHVSAFPPAWHTGRGIPGRCDDFYYWYYGTLATFQMGGDHWKKWNGPMKKTLLDHQCKGGPLDGSVNDKDGSWDVEGWIDEFGGRVFTTAVGALCLEVYYRYLPMYSK